MSALELKLQEEIFSFAIYEAIYLKLLETFLEHLIKSTSNPHGDSPSELTDRTERQRVISDILPIIEVSKRLVADIEQCWKENYLNFDIADILYENITTHFQVYVKYCSNKPNRDRALKTVMNTKPKFSEATKNSKADSVCQGVLLDKFLMLPVDHISDILTSVERIYHWLPPNSPKCNIYSEIIEALCELEMECKKMIMKMKRMEEMLLLTPRIIFKECKPLSLVSSSRWLLKRGEMIHLICDASNKRAFVKSVRWNKVHVHIFLFTDFLIVTKRRGEGNYNVVDYCPKNIVHAELIDEDGENINANSNLRPPPRNYKNLIQVTLWSNHENKTVHMILNCPTQSDRIRWMEALISDNEATDFEPAEKQSNSVVQCIEPYTAQQADELSLYENDIVRVLKEIDGWYKGKHIKDDEIGWFPASYVTKTNVHDVRWTHLSLAHKYSQASYASSTKLPISPK